MSPISPFRIRSTACATCPLHLSTAAAGIAPATISADSSQITVSAPAGATSGDHDVTVKLGTVTSRTYPVGIKVMKKRDIRVTVHKIASIIKDAQGNLVSRNWPDDRLTGVQIKNHLDSIYGPQINATFTVTMNPSDQGEYHDLEWDKGTPAHYGVPGSNRFGPGDWRLEIAGGVLSYEENIIHSHFRDPGSDINVRASLYDSSVGIKPPGREFQRGVYRWRLEFSC